MFRHLDKGLLVNTTVTFPENAAVNACSLFDAVVEQIESNGKFVGSSPIKIGDDIQKLNPCPSGALCGGKFCNTKLGEVCINGVCMIDFCLDRQCPTNSTCKNFPDHAECICNPGFVDIRNVSESVRLAVGYSADQYCLRAFDVDWCALQLDDCQRDLATCYPKVGGFRCECNNGTTDNNPDNPGHNCILIAEELKLAPSTLPWWLMLLLALLFLLLTLW